MAMNAEEYKHLIELRKTYQIRLNVLELYMARDGYEAKPTLLMEVEEIKQKISEIEQVLEADRATFEDNKTNFSPSASHKKLSNKKELVRIELSMDYDMWNPNLQESVIRVLAALVDISPETVRVIQMQRGSVILLVEIPEDAAKRLLTMNASGNQVLREIGVKTITKGQLERATELVRQDESTIHTAIRIVIVDDHLMFRRGVRAILETYPEQVDIIGEAATADEAVMLVTDRVPDLVLLDPQLPERFGMLSRPNWEHGVSAIQRIRRVSPTTHILVLSSLEDPDILFSALRAGAHGYITKGDHYDGTALVNAIRRTMDGEVFYGAMVAQLIREYHQNRRLQDQPSELLTRREIEVLDLLADLKSNSEIAEQLVISVKIVKTYVANILAKLHLESRHENSTHQSRASKHTP